MSDSSCISQKTFEYHIEKLTEKIDRLSERLIELERKHDVLSKFTNGVYDANPNSDTYNYYRYKGIK